jgi:uncharacterized protein involved in response to NO
MAGIQRLRDYRGPALLSYGFRPFFLFGSLYAGLAVLAWLPVLRGQLELASAFAPRDWHVHEMLYGFVPAIVTGFLLTAIPNWTGRLPLQGLPLLTLLALWMAGRAAVGLSALTGWIAAAAIDGAFLLLAAGAAARNCDGKKLAQSENRRAPRHSGCGQRGVSSGSAFPRQR